MKTERRHELQKNELAQWLETTADKVEPHSRTIVAVLITVVVLLGGFYIFRAQATARREAAWDELFTATATGKPEELAEVVNTLGDSAVGPWARLRLADARMKEGLELLFTNRPAALDELRGAEQDFENVVHNSHVDPLLEQRAIFGLARARESLNKLDEARTAYQQLIEDFPDGAFTEHARKRLDDLGRQSTKEFYDWFAQQNPLPASETNLGGPGTGLQFDPQSLPDEPTGLPSTDTSQASPSGDATGGAKEEGTASESTATDSGSAGFEAPAETAETPAAGTEVPSASTTPESGAASSEETTP